MRPTKRRSHSQQQGLPGRSLLQLQQVHPSITCKFPASEDLLGQPEAHHEGPGAHKSQICVLWNFWWAMRTEKGVSGAPNRSLGAQLPMSVVLQAIWVSFQVDPFWECIPRFFASSFSQTSNLTWHQCPPDKFKIFEYLLRHSEGFMSLRVHPGLDSWFQGLDPVSEVLDPQLSYKRELAGSTHPPPTVPIGPFNETMRFMMKPPERLPVLWATCFPRV